MTDINTINDEGDDQDKQQRRPGSLRRRAAARLAAVQTLFQIWASGKPATDVVPSFRSHFLPALLDEFEVNRMDEDHYTRLVFTAASDAGSIDEMIRPLLKEGWTLERMDEVERSVLRAAFVELRDTPHIPAKAVITEFTAIADSCACDSDFINALLDRLARTLRGAEMTGKT
ncbi:transcription antitermination protein NusB [Alphaproteobacteria bacterium LSUCC0684]